MKIIVTSLVRTGVKKWPAAKGLTFLWDKFWVTLVVMADANVISDLNCLHWFILCFRSRSPHKSKDSKKSRLVTCTTRLFICTFDIRVYSVIIIHQSINLSVSQSVSRSVSPSICWWVIHSHPPFFLLVKFVCLFVHPFILYPRCRNYRTQITTGIWSNKTFIRIKN